jgi:hypothetical protein
MIQIPNEELRTVITCAGMCCVLGNLLGVIALLRKLAE